MSLSVPDYLVSPKLVEAGQWSAPLSLPDPTRRRFFEANAEVLVKESLFRELQELAELQHFPATTYLLDEKTILRIGRHVGPHPRRIDVDLFTRTENGHVKAVRVGLFWHPALKGDFTFTDLSKIKIDTNPLSPEAYAQMDLKSLVQRARQLPAERVFSLAQGWQSRCQVAEVVASPSDAQRLEQLLGSSSMISERFDALKVLKIKKVSTERYTLLLQEDHSACSWQRRYLSIDLRVGAGSDLALAEVCTLPTGDDDPFFAGGNKYDLREILEQAAYTRDKRAKMPHVVVGQTQGVHLHQISGSFPDTAGQNILVNQICRELYKMGCQITIYNIGNYIKPGEGSFHGGSNFEDPYYGIVYLDSPEFQFLEKEFIYPHIAELAGQVVSDLQGQRVDVWFGHYPEGEGTIVQAYKLRRFFNPTENSSLILMPHSLGVIKLENMVADFRRGSISASKLQDLTFGARLGCEVDNYVNTMIEATRGESTVRVVQTSIDIKDKLEEVYQVDDNNIIELPPPADTKVHRQIDLDPGDPIYSFVAESVNKTAAFLGSSIRPVTSEQVVDGFFIFEASRTNDTKRKSDLVLAHKYLQLSLREKGNSPQLFSMTNINEKMDANEARRAFAVARQADVAGGIGFAEVFSAEEMLYLRNAAKVVWTASTMEGFGMSMMEAACCGKPIIAYAGKVPFVGRYLMGEKSERRTLVTDFGVRVVVGKAAITVDLTDANEENHFGPKGLAYAALYLLERPDKLRLMSEAAKKIVEERLTIERVVGKFAKDSGIEALLEKYSEQGIQDE
jgi:glycosyltransferase involved in cell wall biosynthesis